MGLPFKSLYAFSPLYGMLRDDYEALKRTNPDNERYANHIVHIYDQRMECLKSSLWFITTIEDVLAKEAWPTDDKAILNLPISSF